MNRGGGGGVRLGQKVALPAAGADPQGVPNTWDAIPEAPRCLLAGRSDKMCSK